MPPKKPIKEKTDKRYRAKVTVGHDADGLPIIKYASGRTKRELEDNKAELRRVYVEGLEDAPRDVLFNQYALEWYEVYKKPHIKEGSRGAYQAAFNKHIFPAFASRQLRAIRQADLQEFFNSRSYMSRTTISYMATIFSGVFKRALIDGIVSRDPTQGLRKAHAPEQKKRALTAAEEAAALHVARTHPEGLLLSVLYYTGMRRGEALGLKWSDFDFTTRKIKICRDIDYKTQSEGELKNASSERVVPMSDMLYDAVNAARGIGDAYVFQSPTSAAHLCEATYKRRWARLMSAMYAFDPSIENSDGRSVLTAHYFRHNFASLCYNAGVDVMTTHKWLGHSDPRTTLSIYTHLSNQKEECDAEVMNSAFLKRLPEGCQT